MEIAAPADDDIRRTAAEVLQRADYELAGDGLSAAGDSLLIRVLRWLLDGFAGLADTLSFLGVFRYPVAALLCVTLVVLIYRLIRTLAGTARRPGQPVDERRERGSRASQPEELEALADAAHRDGQLVEGIRWLLRASMLRIEQAEKRRPRPGTTNRELVRRYRATPLQAPLQTLVDTIDLHWYGDRPAAADDYERCASSYRALRQAVLERTAAAEPETSGGQQ